MTQARLKNCSSNKAIQMVGMATRVGDCLNEDHGHVVSMWHTRKGRASEALVGKKRRNCRL